MKLIARFNEDEKIRYFKDRDARSCEIVQIIGSDSKDAEQTVHCWFTVYSPSAQASLLLPHKRPVIQ